MLTKQSRFLSACIHAGRLEHHGWLIPITAIAIRAIAPIGQLVPIRQKSQIAHVSNPEHHQWALGMRFMVTSSGARAWVACSNERGPYGGEDGRRSGRFNDPARRAPVGAPGPAGAGELAGDRRRSVCRAVGDDDLGRAGRSAPGLSPWSRRAGTSSATWRSSRRSGRWAAAGIITDGRTAAPTTWAGPSRRRRSPRGSAAWSARRWACVRTIRIVTGRPRIGIGDGGPDAWRTRFVVDLTAMNDGQRLAAGLRPRDGDRRGRSRRGARR